jgi:uncharacterized protein
MDIKTFFNQYPSVALAFSGGADSSYLLYEATRSGADVTAYYVKTALQPAFELKDAKSVAKFLGARLTVLESDVFRERRVVENPPDRCYFCKRIIMETIINQAAADGYKTIINGTQASDDAGDRHGMRALEDLSVLSPLRECGITKSEIRALSKEAGLFTWDKPAYACLATRIPTGRIITKELLEKVETAEDLMFAFGFTNFRVRILGDAAKLQLPQDQMTAALEKRDALLDALKPLFASVLLDMESR